MPTALPIAAARSTHLALCMVLAVRAARAQATPGPALVTDRPDYTESPIVVPVRSVQIEAGTTVARSGGVTTRSVGELLVRVGLRRALELRVGLNSYLSTLRTVDDEPAPSGIEDASLGAKLAVVPEARARGVVPTVAVLVGTSLPTGARALRESALTAEAKLLAGWALPAGWELASNVNVASARCVAGACVTQRADGTPRVRRRTGELAASLSAGHALGGRAGMYVELFGGRPTVGDDSWQYANGGVTVAVAPTTQLDARIGRGLGATRRDYFVGVGAAHRF